MKRQNSSFYTDQVLEIMCHCKEAACRPAVLFKDKNGRQSGSPSVSGKHIIGVSKAIAARQGTMGQFLFTGLPGKGQPIDGRLLLSFSGKWTTACAAMWRVLSWYVALSVTSNYWTPNGVANKESYTLWTCKQCGFMEPECKCLSMTFFSHATNKTKTFNCSKNNDHIIKKKKNVSFNNWTGRFVNH